MPAEPPPLPPETFWAAIAGVVGGLLVKAPEWLAKRNAHQRKDNADVSVALIEDRADQRLGIFRELEKVRLRMDRLEDDLQETKQRNIELLVINGRLRLTVARLLAEFQAIRAKFGMPPLDEREYDVPDVPQPEVPSR